LAFVLIATALTAHAQVYKCTDSAGKTLYSGQPCEYGGKPLPLSDNAVQAERPLADAYGTSSSGSNASGASGDCVQAQYEAREQTSKGAPRGIAEASRYRRDAKQLSNQVQVACGGGSARTGAGASSGGAERQQAQRNSQSGSDDCVQAKRELLEQLRKPVPTGIADANRQRQHINQLSMQVEAVCGSGAGAADQPASEGPKRQTAIGPNPYIGQPSTLCPDGSYVRGTSCQLCPDGSYVTGGSGCQITPNGKFIQGGKRSTLCPDGSYVAGACKLGPNGKYYGE
jgi:hypothetical protein